MQAKGGTGLTAYSFREQHDHDTHLYIGVLQIPIINCTTFPRTKERLPRKITYGVYFLHYFFSTLTLAFGFGAGVEGFSFFSRSFCSFFSLDLMWEMKGLR